MSTPRFWTPQLAPGRIELPPEEARHAARSRRLSVDDQVALFDGRGHEADARIVRVAHNRMEVEVQCLAHRPRPTPQFTLATALPKGSRQDLLIEKCTEFGCACVIPLQTHRSVATASAHRVEGWRRTAIEAAKQSGQAWLPDFAPSQQLSETLAIIPTFDRKWIAMSQGDAPPKSPGVATPGTPPWDKIALTSHPSARTIAFVGPEGGWDENEVQSLLTAGAIPICLGPNTLRIETAGIALAAFMHAITASPLQSSP